LPLELAICWVSSARSSASSSRASRRAGTPARASDVRIACAVSTVVLVRIPSAHLSSTPSALNTAKNRKITNRNSAIGLT
jgi:predicted dinucleotide-binding enzyme